MKITFQKTRIIFIFLLLCLLTGVLFIAHDSTVGSSTAAPKELPFDKMDTYTQEFSSHLPIIVIQTDVAELNDRDAPPSAVIWIFDDQTVSYEVNRTENRLTDDAALVFNFANVHYRGVSSLASPKKPYTIMLQNALYNPLEYSFFGLDAVSEWVLRSPYTDKSLMRDWFGYELAAMVLDWQPRGKPVQLFLQDGESGDIEYQGVFFLCHYIPAAAEKHLKLGQFNLHESETIDFNGGGYIFQRNRPGLSNSNVLTKDECNYRIMSPRLSNLTEEQNELLASEVEFISDFTRKTGNYDNLAAGQWDYENYLDIDSFINYFLVVELLKTVDAGFFSTYMYRPVGGKIFMGPLWDNDRSMGNIDYHPANYYNFWTFHRIPVIMNLLDDAVFTELLIERWLHLRNSIWADAEILGLFDEMAEYLKQPAALNAERWPELFDLETRISPNPEPESKTWEEEIERMREWLKMRLEWLDGNIPRLIVESAEDINNEYTGG